MAGQLKDKKGKYQTPEWQGKKRRERLCKKYDIKDYSKGAYAEGLFDGLEIAEKKQGQFLSDIKKELKEKADNAESGRYAFLEAIKIIDKLSGLGDEKDDRESKFER